MSIELLPVRGLPEVHPGDDLAELLAPPLGELGLREGDIVIVTQKVVSKAEGRLVRAGEDERAAWIAREARRIVARRGDLVIAETRHGFVCANAGVDASNVDAGWLSLLPEDPDASAERLRAGLAERLGVAAAVVITDTFGRAWRSGVVNVAIGCAGLPALVDLRGTLDDRGRILEATVVALADELAAASGLVIGKASRTPAALVRGLAVSGPHQPARALVRASEDDLFRFSPIEAIVSRRTIRSLGSGAVPREAVEEAIRAACTAPAPHHSRPWMFSVLESPGSRRGLRAAMAAAWRADLERDGLPQDVIARRLAGSDAVLGAAPLLIVPWVRLAGAHPYPDAERAGAEREMFLLSGGAAIQNLLLALHAQGLASAWISSTLFCQEETRAALGVEEDWHALGTVAVGRPPDGVPPPRPSLSLEDVLRWA